MRNNANQRLQVDCLGVPLVGDWSKFPRVNIGAKDGTMLGCREGPIVGVLVDMAVRTFLVAEVELTTRGVLKQAGQIVLVKENPKITTGGIGFPHF